MAEEQALTIVKSEPAPEIAPTPGPSTIANDPSWKRQDGSLKGNGFLGLLKRPDGRVSSEISIGVNIGGKEVEIPTLVPTLSSDEKNWLLTNDISDPSKIPMSIQQKAIDFAKPRIAAGKSPFAGPNESPAAQVLQRASTLPTLKIIKSEPEPGFMERLGAAAVDIPTGMVKQAGRYVQAIPGVAAATDAIYGLPSGASKQSMQPANANETAGGYLGDLALTVATGGAEAGPAILSKTAGYVSNPTVAARGIAKLGDAARFTGDVASLVKANLATGPLTAAKVADLVTRYGSLAVKGAILGTFGKGAYEAYKHLF